MLQWCCRSPQRVGRGCTLSYRVCTSPQAATLAWLNRHFSAWSKYVTQLFQGQHRCRPVIGHKIIVYRLYWKSGPKQQQVIDERDVANVWWKSISEKLDPLTYQKAIFVVTEMELMQPGSMIHCWQCFFCLLVGADIFTLLFSIVEGKMLYSSCRLFAFCLINIFPSNCDTLHLKTADDLIHATRW